MTKRNSMIPSYWMIPVIRWSPAIWWSIGSRTLIIQKSTVILPSLMVLFLFGFLTFHSLPLFTLTLSLSTARLPLLSPFSWGSKETQQDWYDRDLKGFYRFHEVENAWTVQLKRKKPLSYRSKEIQQDGYDRGGRPLSFNWFYQIEILLWSVWLKRQYNSQIHLFLALSLLLQIRPVLLVWSS